MNPTPNPYIGPRPFDHTESDRFFGRETEARRLRDNVLAYGMVLLYAPSGIGKTSLLNAKLRDMLETDGFQVLPIARVKGFVADGRYPEGVANVFVYNVLAHLSRGEVPADFAGATLAEFLGRCERPLDEFGEPRPRALIIDQFEELFTTHEEYAEHRKDFFRQLRTASEDSSLRIVLAIREDYLATVTQYAEMLHGLEARIQLPPLTLSGALQAVTSPARGTGRAYDPDEKVAEELVRNLSTRRIRTERGETVEVPGDSVEPVQLQVVCRRLWENTDSPVITMEEMRRYGDVDAALRWFYEESIAAAVDETGVDEGRLRAWIGSNLITAADTRGMIVEDRSGVDFAMNAAIRVLDGRHVIRAERRHGARWYELTHDRLIKPIQISNRFFEEQHKDLEDPVRQAHFLLRDRLTKGMVLSGDEYRQLSMYEDRIDWTGGNAADALRWSPAELMLRSAIHLLSRTDSASVRSDLKKWSTRVGSATPVLESRDVPAGGEFFNRQQLQALGEAPEAWDLNRDQLAFVVSSYLKHADDGQRKQIARWTRKWKEKSEVVTHA